MSAPRSADRFAPRHRKNLPRQRKNVRFEFRPGVYAALISMAKEGEPLIETVERLILQAKGYPAGRREYVHERLELPNRVA